MLKIRRAFQESFSVKTLAARILRGKVITGKLFTEKVVRSSIAFPPHKSSPSESFFNLLIKSDIGYNDWCTVQGPWHGLK